MNLFDLQAILRFAWGFILIARLGFSSGPAAAISARWVTTPPQNVAELAQHYQVLQRDQDDQGACFLPVRLSGEARDCKLIIGGPDKKKVFEKSFTPRAEDQGTSQGIYIEGLPVGGPYTLGYSPPPRPQKDHNEAFQNILVGDLWVLAGQSNQQGVFAPVERLPINPLINMLDRPTEQWMPASDPVHHLVGSYARAILKTFQLRTPAEIDDIVKSGQPMGGVNAANFFARELVRQTGIPMGLIPCALAGPTLELWSPAHRNEPDSLYCVMLRHVSRSGGRVRGMLWYQGESDANCNSEGLKTYHTRFAEFVEAIRADFHNTALPVFTAQVCRWLDLAPEIGCGAEGMREEQRLAADTIPNVYMAATVDLDLGDGVHIDPASQKRLAARWAWLALPHVKKGLEARPGVKFVSARFETAARRTIILDFTGFTAPLKSCGRPLGFEMRDAEGKRMLMISRIDFDSTHPGRILLRMKIGAPANVSVVYAPGPDPPANITDENDMALPGFGPIPIKESA